MSTLFKWLERPTKFRLSAAITKASTVRIFKNLIVLTSAENVSLFGLVYLFLGKDATSVQLMMSFGSSGIGENRSAMTRLWRIKIGLLPCYADYLGIQNISLNFSFSF